MRGNLKLQNNYLSQVFISKKSIENLVLRMVIPFLFVKTCPIIPRQNRQPFGKLAINCFQRNYCEHLR